MRYAVTIASFAGLLAATAAINLLLLPDDHLISSLYAVPALVACLRLSPRDVAGIAAAGVLLYLVSAAVERRPPMVWSIGVLTLSLTGYLMVRHADQRQIILKRAGEADQARRRLQMFLGMVAHDLAGALTNLLAGASLLSGESVADDDTGRHGRMALDGATREMQRLLSDLRDAAAIGAGRFSIRPVPTDLAGLVHEVVVEQQRQTERHRIVVQGPRELRGEWDTDRLRQLLTNLVSNAVKYSPNGGEIRVSLRRERGAATIRVADHGVGISPDQGAALFQPFTRLNSGIDVSGSGLGLAISKAIAEAHGGCISVASVPGNGSVFTVRLPCGDGIARAGPRPERPTSTQPEPASLFGTTMTAGQSVQ